jgi:hypothetical protein
LVVGTRSAPCGAIRGSRKSLEANEKASSQQGDLHQGICRLGSKPKNETRNTSRSGHATASTRKSFDIALAPGLN